MKDNNDFLYLTGKKIMISALPQFQYGQTLILWKSEAKINLWMDKSDIRHLLNEYNEININRSKLIKDELESAENEDEFIDLMFERYEDLLNNPVPLDQLSSISSQISSDVLNDDSNCIDTVVSLADDDKQQSLYSHQNYGYKSTREEIWVKPPLQQREDYYISNYYDIPDNIILPLTKKQFDIILLTVKNVRQQPQLELVLKLKQAENNLTFDFLNHECELFPLYQSLRKLPEEIFWKILLSKQKDENENVVTNDRIENGEVQNLDNSNDDSKLISSKMQGLNALLLLGNMYENENDDGDDDGDNEEENHYNKVELDNNSFDSDNANDNITEINSIVKKSDICEENVNDNSDNNIDTRIDNTNETICISIQLIDSSEEKVDINTTENHTQSSLNLADNLTSDSDANDNEIIDNNDNINTVNPISVDEYDTENDDLLDEDVDMNEIWGKFHLLKIERLKIKAEKDAKKRKADRLKKAKELKNHFLNVASTNEKIDELIINKNSNNEDEFSDTSSHNSYYELKNQNIKQDENKISSKIRKRSLSNDHIKNKRIKSKRNDYSSSDNSSFRSVKEDRFIIIKQDGIKCYMTIDKLLSEKEMINWKMIDFKKALHDKIRLAVDKMNVNQDPYEALLANSNLSFPILDIKNNSSDDDNRHHKYNHMKNKEDIHAMETSESENESISINNNNKLNNFDEKVMIEDQMTVSQYYNSNPSSIKDKIMVQLKLILENDGIK
eukprot:gene12627-16932_t